MTTQPNSDTPNLPPLPAEIELSNPSDHRAIYGYTDEQMHTYALAAIAATQRQPLTDDEIAAIGHRKASTYAHRSDPTSHAYGFVRHTLIDFARAIEAAITRKGE